ncbi:hypothetical protein LSH36_603g00005 [Paralvinella palmiformis]|uniref:G-protein coupled receptors family 1 profile domain-containing protein n=1 Tax=Paralvinella palmiformis TaxID=53620 RepID=A0AAD9MWB7_9ANNE|nr:hypothetical protein LSH36_603g00005 [Paralvinella palmiformis]
MDRPLGVDPFSGRSYDVTSRGGPLALMFSDRRPIGDGIYRAGELPVADGVLYNASADNLTGSGVIDVDAHEQLKWGVMALWLVIVATAIGNILVCLAVCWDRRLQNMTNYFLMSLAIADLLVAILVMPLGLVIELYETSPDVMPSPRTCTVINCRLHQPLFEAVGSLKTRYTSVFPSTILRSPFPFCSPFPHRSAYLLDELTKYGTKTDEERNIMMRRTVPCAMKIRRRNISSYNRKTDEWPMVIIQKSGLSWGRRLLDETRQSWRQGSGGNNTWQTPIIRPLTMYRQTSLN